MTLIARSAACLLLAASPMCNVWAQADAAPPTVATPATATVPSANAGRPLWELGVFAFGVSQQAYPGSDQNIGRGLALPYGIYRGEVLRADEDGAGLRAFKSPRFELDVGFAGSFGSSSERIEARRGMPNLGTLIEFGPMLTWKLSDPAVRDGSGRWTLELPLRGVFDINDGWAHRGMSFEPELIWSLRRRGGWSGTARVGLLVADQRLGRHFYGVESRFATASRPAYDAKSGLVATRLAFTLSRSLGPDWNVFGFARFDSVTGAANESSPLVRQTTGATYGIGLSWTWLRSDVRVRD
ncbi:MAG: MipA/OmpV family protein [Rubrivivax sp.]|jgi:outer membrane scaffolding protein for murein synthesis (MipA/OmpV family)|nr:MipA/OmpV family protein [Rubrivivax sp.]